MARAVMRPPPCVHEDYAIVSIDPLPPNPLQFHTVREVVEEFFEQHMNVGIRDIQLSHLGQTLVRFDNIFDHDMLVNNSPHPYGGVNFQVVRHNDGRNWRVIQFNQECWLMPLGFPLDYGNNDSIHNALASFCRMIMWENDRAHLARLIVRARVTDLREAPYFLVLTKAEGFQGESWTVQVEIVDQEMLGALPADEDPVRVPQENGQLLMFNFFGLGQQGLPPQQQGNNQVWGQQGDGVRGQNDQIFDLNMEVVVEGDDEALLMQEQILHDQEMGQPEPVVIIDLNAPLSIGINSSDIFADGSKSVGVVSEEFSLGQLVLGLQVSPVNFGVAELQADELMSDE
jgi:hypothetical protein